MVTEADLLVTFGLGIHRDFVFEFVPDVESDHIRPVLHLHQAPEDFFLALGYCTDPG